MKKTLLSFLFLIPSFIAFAQQDAQFSQFMFNRLAINPGYAGSSNAICSSLLGREQWVGFNDGRPKTYLLSIDAPVKILRGGVGMNIMQDRVGFFSSTMVNLGYAYRMNLGPGILGAGFNVGMFNNSIKGTWRSVDDYTLDPSIPNSNVSDLVFDASFGLYYNIADQFYVGLSTTHLPASTLTSTGGSGSELYNLNFDLARHYYLMAGYSYRISEFIELKPSMLAKTDGASAQFDLNFNVMYNRMVWAGMSYRTQDAMIAMVGFQHPSGVKVGFAYDFTTSGFSNAGRDGRRVNTFEVMLGYCFKISPKMKLSKHRNVRFL
jgi:type IX secretion system PorP/SprF family membrane protein